MISIAELKKGQRAVIKGFDAEAIPIKLLELGCLPGNEVEVLQVAPLKDPLHINLNGSQIAIRKRTAEKIEIELKEDTSN